MAIRVGRLNFLNAFPIYLPFDLGVVESDLSISFVYGPPSELSWKLRNGDLDASLISVVEYWDNPNSYVIMGDLCIGVKGRVRSVALFSKKPMEELDRIYLTQKSLTSRRLLSYILQRKGFSPELLDLEGDYRGKEAVLLIGDEALYALKDGFFPFVYDLSELWYNIEKLPFVFAFWCLRRDFLKSYPLLSRKLKNLFLKARNWGENNMEIISKKWLEENKDKGFSLGEILDYLTNLDYKLSEEHIKGINRFFEVLGRKVELYFLDD